MFPNCRSLRSIAESAARILYAVTIVLGSLFVFSIFIQYHSLNAYERARFADMLQGTAYRPFVCRTLVPTAVRLLSSPVPAAVRVWAIQAVESNQELEATRAGLMWEKDYLVEYAIASVLIYAALLGFLWAFGYLFDAVYHPSLSCRRVVTLAALAILPTMFRYINYIYDLPTLFLFTLGLGLMVRRRWGVFLAVYGLACLNKETTILLTMIFVLYYFPGERMGRIQFGRLLAWQGLIYVPIRLGLFYIFRNAPGSVVEYQLPHNFHLLARTYLLSDVFILLALILSIFYHWRQKPLFLRRSMSIMIPLLGLTLFFGFLDELRDYYEAYPVMILLGAQTFAELIGVELGTLRDPVPLPVGRATSPLGGANGRTAPKGSDVPTILAPE